MFYGVQLPHVWHFTHGQACLKLRGLETKLCITFPLFLFWKEFRRIKVKESMHFAEQKYKKKKKQNRIENGKFHTQLERRSLGFSSYKNHKLRIKLWWVGARERNKRLFFVPFLLPEGNFFKICVLSQCTVYWKHFQNINPFTCQKTFCLFLKLSNAFSLSLNHCFW